MYVAMEEGEVFQFIVHYSAMLVLKRDIIQYDQFVFIRRSSKTPFKLYVSVVYMKWFSIWL